MTNFEKYMSMSIEEFAETRVDYDDGWGCFRNDTGESYYENDGYKLAIKDEIQWLRQEVDV